LSICKLNTFQYLDEIWAKFWTRFVILDGGKMTFWTTYLLCSFLVMMSTHGTAITLPSNDAVLTAALPGCLITWPADCTLRMTWTRYTRYKPRITNIRRPQCRHTMQPSPWRLTFRAP